MMAHTFNASYCGGRGGRIMVYDQSVQKNKTPLKNKKHKAKVNEHSSVVQRLPCKLEALSSDPSATKKKTICLLCNTCNYMDYFVLCSQGMSD